MSNIQCNERDVYGHRKNAEKCKPEDVKHWLIHNRTHDEAHMKTTAYDITNAASHTTTENSEEYDTADDFYNVVLCASHEVEGAHDEEKTERPNASHETEHRAESTGLIADKSCEKIESLSAHPFITKRAHVIPRGIG